jgi:hypothetical protein
MVILKYDRHKSFLETVVAIARTPFSIETDTAQSAQAIQSINLGVRWQQLCFRARLTNAVYCMTVDGLSF